jgi:hypothetical protein
LPSLIWLRPAGAGPNEPFVLALGSDPNTPSRAPEPAPLVPRTTILAIGQAQ